MQILRRTWIKMLAASAAMSPVLSMAAKADDAGKRYILPLDGPVPPDEVKILGGYLTQYTPPAELMSPKGGWRAVYDILAFETDKKIRKRQMVNSVMGQVAVTRAPGSSDYQIQMQYTPAQGLVDASASIRCNADAIRSIREYELTWQAGSFVRREAGTVLSDAMKVAAVDGAEALPLQNSPTCLWTLLDAVRLLPADPSKKYSFDLFMDLSSVRRSQKLAFARADEVMTASGKIPVHFFRQTGTGVEPIHYAVDEQQRTLFATQGQLGWGLNRIERV